MYTHKLGIEIADHAFRLVELRYQNNVPTILHADEFATEYNFGSHLLHDAPFNEALAKSLLRDLTLFFRRQKIFSSSVSVTIASHVPFIATLPIDASQTSEEQLRHLRWECELHLPHWRNIDLKIFTHPLSENDGAKVFLTIALPSRTVQFLSTIFSLLTLKLDNLMIDHFAVEHAVDTLVHTKTYALLGFHEHYFTLSLYQDHIYIGYKTHQFQSREHTISAVLRALHELLHSPADGILRTLFVYGPACEDAVIHALRSLLTITVQRFDPLSKISFHNPAEAEPALRYPPTTFSAALGAALQMSV